MKIITPGEIPTGQLHAYMLASIAPRPICFASTVDKDGKVNLSPFSFFNAFGSNPPTVVFSPARRVRDNSIKHTLQNAKEIGEVCINVVTYDMVWQTSLASVEYPDGINEFVKAGFTEIPSTLIRPPRVKESPVQMECIVKNIIETGDSGGAGNLIICEIKRMHINEDVLDENGMIDQRKIHLVARMGKDWYCKAFGDALFEVEKPNTKIGIGIDSLPESVRLSNVLTGNNLGQLGNLEKIPDGAEIEEYKQHNTELKDLMLRLAADTDTLEEHKHQIAKDLLAEGQTAEALKVLLA